MKTKTINGNLNCNCKTRSEGTDYESSMKFMDADEVLETLDELREVAAVLSLVCSARITREDPVDSKVLRRMHGLLNFAEAGVGEVMGTLQMAYERIPPELRLRGWSSGAASMTEQSGGDDDVSM